jgi:hypothetical protein
MAKSGKKREKHDQRFKRLLEEFFRELLELFWPEWAILIDFGTVTWLKEEVFSDPREGKLLRMDLVAKMKLKEPVTADQAGQQDWLALIHIEIESRESLERLRPQVYRYYHKLREKHGLPVLPLAMLLQVGLDGLGVDVYEEHFGKFRPLHFQYLYVGLPALDGKKYLDGNNVLGLALAPLMKVPAGERAELTAKALDRLAKSGENDRRRQMLFECVEAYSPLTESQKKDLKQLLVGEQYSEVRAMNRTWVEEGQILILQKQLEKRFGPLSAKAKEALDQWPSEELMDLAEAIVDAKSLQELGLEDDK